MSKMKYAFVFPDHRGTPRGPIPRSLFQLAEEREIDKLFLTRKEKWDDYDALIYFHNQCPNIRAKRAKVAWWMCDLRLPGQVNNLKLKPVKLTANERLVRDTPAWLWKEKPEIPKKLDYIFLCNQFLIDDFAEAFDAQVHHMPQCGDDLPMAPSKRKLSSDVLFIGATEEKLKRLRPCDAPDTKLVNGAGHFRPLTLEEIGARRFHTNRSPILVRLRRHCNLKVISKEGTTVDAKQLYRNVPISLAISPPVQGYTSNRLYNILSAGGFCLTLWFPGIEELFKNHKHLVWFHSTQEAIELVQHYLKKPESRKRIQAAGHKEYLSRHTAAHRVDAMLRAMS